MKEQAGIQQRYAQVQQELSSEMAKVGGPQGGSMQLPPMSAHVASQPGSMAVPQGGSMQLPPLLAPMTTNPGSVAVQPGGLPGSMLLPNPGSVAVAPAAVAKYDVPPTVVPTATPAAFPQATIQYVPPCQTQGPALSFVAPSVASLGTTTRATSYVPPTSCALPGSTSASYVAAPTAGSRTASYVPTTGLQWGRCPCHRFPPGPPLQPLLPMLRMPRWRGRHQFQIPCNGWVHWQCEMGSQFVGQTRDRQTNHA